MLQTLRLLLPALIPSWRFFDSIAPSPRIEFTLLKTPEESPGHWQEFRPRPMRMPVSDILKRLFFNPRWNESLFLVSCAERLMATQEEHSRREIFSRIKAGIGPDVAEETPYLQFRLAFLSRHGAEVQKQVTFVSPVSRCCGNADS